MSLVAILLIGISALLHAGWNLFSKSRHPTTAFFFLSTAVGAILLFPLLLINLKVLPNIPLHVWCMLLVTGFFMAMYYAALAGAYRSGKMSVAYPLARALPIIFVTIITFLLGEGSSISTRCLGGMLLVVLGCFLLPKSRFNDFRLKNYINATCGLAMLAALGTVGYSMIDDAALRQLRGISSLGLSINELTLLYASLETWASGIWLGLFLLLQPGTTHKIRSEIHANLYQAAITGIIIWVAYALVLIAMSYAQNVSYIVAFRQLSIPLGAILGILLLKENPARPKIAGVFIMFVGLVLIALG